MKVALIHDYLTQFGGGERVLQTLCEMFPEAPIYTLIYDEKKTNGAFKSRKIRTSFLQKIPGAKKYFRGLIWLMPLAIEQFNLSDFDVVISVSHSYGKGVITKPGTKHICYCFTPTRYLWNKPGLPFRPLSQFLLTYLRNWDYQAARRPDYFIAVSEVVRQRIKKYYGRESAVIYPPVSLEHRIQNVEFSKEKKEKDSKFYILNSPYFLAVGRLVPYKRFDLAINAFAKMPNENLVVIGDGPMKKNLELRTKNLGLKNIKFLGQVSDAELQIYYANCKALVFPQEEDFGLVPLEAMAAGRPVIAYRAGGTLETVKEGKSGIFFSKQTPESLSDSVKKFSPDTFSPQKIKDWAGKFDKEIFKRKFSEFINNV